jgi:aerobic carbon-monoxide dehydrogenase large subunit
MFTNPAKPAKLRFPSLLFDISQGFRPHTRLSGVCMNQMNMKFGVGASVLRKEDDSFVRGRGRYTDDLKIENCLRGFVLRSQIASGTFRIGSLAAAKAAPGVRLILTGKDVKHLKPLASWYKVKGPDGTKYPTRDIPILCDKHVRHVGDALAFIVADTVAQAQDAAELIEVNYDSRAANAVTAKALEKGAPLVWPEAKTNLAYIETYGRRAKTDAAFRRAAHISRIAFYNNRLVANYLETRSAIGAWDKSENRFTLTCGSQGVHGVRKRLADKVFGIPKSQLRVVTPDVGGGFGPKALTYREYALVLEAAKRLGRPVKWTGDRTEHFLVDAQGRDNLVEAEMAMDRDGKFLGLRIGVVANMGAYLSENGALIPNLGASMAPGLYDIPAVHMEIKGVYTNTAPLDAYRGAGRPEATYLLERLVDECARDLNLPPEEIRRRNFIRPDQFPYKTQVNRIYDVGEFAAHMDKAMAEANWNSFERRLGASKAAGKLRGIGMATYIEACAFEGSEPAVALLRADGTIELRIGTQSNGQGHATAYAQFVAEKLNIGIDKIEVRQGDTDELAKGGGTGGSRSIPLGGVSASRAGQALSEKIKKIAADELEASPADIELIDGIARIVGTDRRMTFRDVAKHAASPEDLKAVGEFEQDESTYPNGTHICELELDPATGATRIERYTIVDDFGVVVNPILLAGQVHGGVAQGIGQALCEDTIYTPDGQLLTASFMDYALPRAADMPNFDFTTRNVPSKTNAMGIKGAGEAGTIGSAPAVMNAVVDALWRAYGIRHVEMPATPNRVWQTIQNAKRS